jgi:hypothetical protein
MEAKVEDNDGSLEVSLRVLGNELLGFKMKVDDFKMKWLILGVAALAAVGVVAMKVGPHLVTMMGGAA